MMGVQRGEDLCIAQAPAGMNLVRTEEQRAVRGLAKSCLY